ncbi:hypothetical protein D3C87_1603930 [compost metagenome]
MVAGVADKVHEWISQAFDHRLVDLCAFALGLQLDLFARFPRQVMDQTAEPTKKLGDRHHSQDHHRIAKFSGKTFDILRNRAQKNIDAATRQLRKAGLGNDEFTDPIHQLVKSFSRHPYVFGRLAALRIGGDLSGFRQDLGNGELFFDNRFDCADIDLHVIHHEDENVVDCRLRLLGRQPDCPA